MTYRFEAAERPLCVKFNGNTIYHRNIADGRVDQKVFIPYFFFTDKENGLIFYPAFVKPVKGSASMHINKVTTDEELPVFENSKSGVKVEKMIGHVCPRCWNVFDSLEEDGVCTRCHNVLQD